CPWCWAGSACPCLRPDTRFRPCTRTPPSAALHTWAHARGGVDGTITLPPSRDSMSMFALFDDAGKFLAGRVMSEADSSMQIELDSGKRVKVKAANVLLKFAKPSPAELLAQAAAQSSDIDLDLIWEVAPEDEFGFEDLAREI